MVRLRESISMQPSLMKCTNPSVLSNNARQRFRLGDLKGKSEEIGAAIVPPQMTGPRARQCDGQILQTAPVPGIWTSGPLAGGPTKCESALRSRTAP
jgi:hypothetical protein